MLLLLTLTSLAQVPAIAVGPELKEDSPLFDAPIDQVTVYSDRARIVRRARADAKAGVSGYRLPDLPGGVLLDTVRVSAPGARVIRAEVSPVEREVISIDQVKGLYEQYLGASHGEVAVVGDFDVKTVTESLSSMLEGWQAKMPYARIKYPAPGTPLRA